jgi:hypothetical protein
MAAAMRKDMAAACEPLPPTRRKALQPAVILMIKPAEIVTAAVKEDPKGNPAALAEALAGAFESAAKGTALDIDFAPLGQALTARLEKFDAIAGNEDEVRAACGEAAAGALRKIAAGLKPTPEDEKLEKAELDAMQKEVDEAGGDADEDIDLLKTMDEAEPSSTDKVQQDKEAQHEIQPLIDKLERTKKILGVAEKMADMGISLAVKLFPPASAAKDFKKFAVETMKAVKHAQALIEWLDHKSMSKKARSPVLEAVKNRVGNEERQHLEHSIQASLSLLAGISKVIGSAVPHAAPAVVVGEAINLLQSGIDIGSGVLTEVQMAVAWNTYKKALANPKDRKQARMAMQQNPTLAKYAIAYGAFSAEDPAAKQIANKCNLSLRVLQNPKTNVQNIVKYLEALYDEDPVLLRAVAVPVDWHPGKPELTAGSWAAFQVAAKKDARPQLVNLDKGPVAAALVRMAQAEKALREAVAQSGAEDRQAPEPDQLSVSGVLGEEAPPLTDGLGLDKAVFESYRDSLDNLQDALTRYKPLTKNGMAHAETEDYVGVLLAQLDLKRRSLPKEVVAKAA